MSFAKETHIGRLREEDRAMNTSRSVPAVRAHLRSFGAIFIALTIAPLMLDSPAGAQSDHLKCYKVKDPLAKAVYTATLTGLSVEAGCQIKVPAVLACVPATKRNVTPPTAGGPSETLALDNAYGCYKVKCPSATLRGLVLNDQFGARTVTPTTPKIVCAPAAPPAFPPCSTPGTMCGSCVATPDTIFANECLPLCDRGCENACVQAFMGGPGCLRDSDCPFGEACAQLLFATCGTLGCTGPLEGTCVAPCP
jgi:hypothetical protein